MTLTFLALRQRVFKERQICFWMEIGLSFIILFFMMTGELLYTPAEEVVILWLHTKKKQVGSSTCMYKIDHIRWTKVMDWLTGKNTSGKGKHVHRHVSFHSNQKTEIAFSKKPMANLPAYVPPWFLWLNNQKCHVLLQVLLL